MTNNHLINDETICFLRMNPNTQLVEVEFETILKPLDVEFKKIKILFESNTFSPLSIISKVKYHPVLNVLFKTFDYGATLDMAYQGFNKTIEDIEESYSSFMGGIEETKKEKERLLIELENRLRAYYYEIAYEHFRERLRNNQVMAFSHRLVGWEVQPYQLNPNFHIELISNFGYGSKSYFYTRLKYKDFYIIPFSDWVVYETIQSLEIIRYSKKHYPSYESWVDAFYFCKDACNLALQDEIAFIKKFILEECEKMVIGLEEFLKGDRFQFINLQKIPRLSSKNGHSLTEFRGEKITGAISLIEQILKFEKVAEVKEFINRIENCNKLLQPMLEAEIPIINKELTEVNIKRDKLRKGNFDFQRRGKDFEIKKEQLKQKMIAAGELLEDKMDDEKLNNRFLEDYPDYETFDSDFFMNIHSLNYESNKRNDLEITKKNIETYSEVIKEYFAKLN